MSWGIYTMDANESYTPQTFRASNQAMHMHNSEVYRLECEITRLKAELKEGKNETRHNN